MEHWHIWVIIGVALLIAEIFTPGFVLACFGVGCLVAALFAAFDLGLTVEVIIFCIASVVAFFAVRPLFVKRFYRSDNDAARTNVDALVGKQGMVAERIDPSQNVGRINLGGDSWKAISEDGAVIERGEKVEVTRVEGTKLYVKEIPKKKEG
ncbi:MAG: NfeD family protein [Candidatus Coatesbacteria bacterium]|nr:NfeD family protein [Candidatus Coatesbacteria bacterium]